jgi:putative ABC transport system permease protein
VNPLAFALAALRQQPGKSAALALAATLAFLVYGVFGALGHALAGSPREPAGLRLVSTHVAGLMENLPMAHAARVAALPGVARVGHATWWGAYWRDEREMPLTFAVDAAAWLEQHPEMRLAPEARRDFLAQPDSILVSEALAARYGWKRGDIVPLGSILYPPPAGEPAWRFRVAGVFGSDDARGSRNYLIGHHSFLDAHRPMWRHTVGTLMVTAQPGHDLQALAQRIDELFLNSEAPTSTTTDQAFQLEFLAQFGNVAAALQAIVGAALLSAALVLGSAAALTVRQSTRDIGVLKVMGFGPLRVVALVGSQVALPLLAGAALGLAGAALANHLLTSALPQYLPSLVMPAAVLLKGLGWTLVLLLATTLPPALLALRIRPREAFAVDAA